MGVCGVQTGDIADILGGRVRPDAESVWHGMIMRREGEIERKRGSGGVKE